MPGAPVGPRGGSAAFVPSPFAAERQRQVERTKTGILILLVGALLSWIPVIGLLGTVLTLVGAILVILGRQAFGATHRRFILVSVVLFIVGIAVALVGGAIGLLAATNAFQTAPNEFALAAALQEAATTIVLFAAVAAFVAGLASVFFTYALQNPRGRLVLWAAFAATIAVQFATLFVALPVLSEAARTIAQTHFIGGAIDPTAIADAVTNAIAGVQYLNVIPSLLYAFANYIVWDRINRGEIPPPATPPVAPIAASPPAPPIPPM